LRERLVKLGCARSHCRIALGSRVIANVAVTVSDHACIGIRNHQHAGANHQPEDVLRAMGKRNLHEERLSRWGLNNPVSIRTKYGCFLTT
jgi:hypothetical protein